MMTLAMSLSLVTPAFALDSFEAGTNVIETEPYNEYDYICALRNASVAQLHAEGITVQESISAINEFEAAFDLRSTLSDDELKDLGYSSEAIQLLRRYANGEELSTDEMRAATATCSGSIQLQYFSGRKVSVVYRWTWSMCPTVQKTDAAAMRWVVADPNGTRIEDILCSFKNAYVTYYRGDEVTYTRNATFQAINSFDAVNAQFPMSYAGYGKIGCIKITITLPDNVNNTINSIKFAAKYGHTLSSSAAPTLSVGLPWSLSITFTQSESVVQRLADCKDRVSSSGIEKI